MSPIEVYKPIFKQMFDFVELLTSNDSLDFTAKKQEIATQFDKCFKQLITLGYDETFSQNAQFAVVALFDESVLNTGHSNLAVWQSAPLQKTLYGTTKAGVEFFERLDDVSKFDNPAQELRLVYFYCLKMGFSGKYFDVGSQSDLESIIDANYKLLKVEVVVPKCEFSEQQTQFSSVKSIKHNPVFNVFITWLPLLAVILIYLYLRADMSSMINTLLAGL